MNQTFFRLDGIGLKFLKAKNKFRKDDYKMYVNKNALNLFMAEKCMNPYEVCRKAAISYETFRKIRNGKKAKPATIGKIAAALGVPVEKLLYEGGD